MQTDELTTYPLLACLWPVARLDGTILRMTRSLLIVAHAPSPNTQRLREAAARGARHPDGRAGQNDTGKLSAIKSITTAMPWKLVKPPLLCSGDFQQDFIIQRKYLGLSMAAGLDNCIIQSS